MATSTPTKGPDYSLYEKHRANITLPPPKIYVAGDTFTAEVTSYTIVEDGILLWSLRIFLPPNLGIVNASSTLHDPMIFPPLQSQKWYTIYFSNKDSVRSLPSGLVKIGTITFKVLSVDPGQMNIHITGKLLTILAKNGLQMCDSSNKDLPCNSSSRNGFLFTPGSTNDIYFNYDVNVPIKNTMGHILVSNNPTLPNPPFMAAIDTNGNGYYFDESYNQSNITLHSYIVDTSFNIKNVNQSFKDLSYSFGKAMCLDANGIIYYNPIFPNDIWLPVSGDSLVSTQKATQISFDGNTNEVCIIDSNNNCFYSTTLGTKWVPLTSPSNGLTFNYVQCSNSQIVVLCSDKNIYYISDFTKLNNWTKIALPPDNQNNINTPMILKNLSFNGYETSGNNLIVMTNESLF